MSHLRQLIATAARQYACLSKNVRCSAAQTVLINNFHTSSCRNFDIGELMGTQDQKKHRDDTSAPEKKYSIKIPAEFMPDGKHIPSARTHNHLIDGVKFKDLPRVIILARIQNTLVSANDPRTGKCLTTFTGGTVGFKHAKKRTETCGQTVGLATGMELVKKGYKNVRVIVSGQGRGRLSAMKGLQVAGLNIVSITDKTYPNVTTRPRGKKDQ